MPCDEADSDSSTLDRSFGREAFGIDPANYAAARPPYPDAVWAVLAERCGLGAGVEILEIGAGTGLATAELLTYQPKRLVAVEPDPRLAAFLRETIVTPQLDVRVAPFEEAEFSPASFDLVVTATAFHWLEAAPALARIHDLLRPRGAVALWWNVFGDSSRPDPFHQATTHLFVGRRNSPATKGSAGRHYALDGEHRTRELRSAGFVPDAPQVLRWTLALDPAGVRNLYATYSNVVALPADERQSLLDALTEIAGDQFSGNVTRTMTTAIYTARRS